MNDISIIYNRLINISKKIVDEFDILGKLSFMNRENTGQFADHVSDLAKLLEVEQIVLHNLQPLQFKALCEYFLERMDISLPYSRSLNLICDYF